MPCPTNSAAPLSGFGGLDVLLQGPYSGFREASFVGNIPDRQPVLKHGRNPNTVKVLPKSMSYFTQSSILTCYAIISERNLLSSY